MYIQYPGDFQFLMVIRLISAFFRNRQELLRRRGVQFFRWGGDPMDLWIQSDEPWQKFHATNQQFNNSWHGTLQSWRCTSCNINFLKIHLTTEADLQKMEIQLVVADAAVLCRLTMKIRWESPDGFSECWSSCFHRPPDGGLFACVASSCQRVFSQTGRQASGVRLIHHDNTSIQREDCRSTESIGSS